MWLNLKRTVKYIFHFSRGMVILRKNKKAKFIKIKNYIGRLYHGEKYPYDKVINTILLCVFKLEDNEDML